MLLLQNISIYVLLLLQEISLAEFVCYCCKRSVTQTLPDRSLATTTTHSDSECVVVATDQSGRV